MRMDLQLRMQLLMMPLLQTVLRQQPLSPKLTKKKKKLNPPKLSSMKKLSMVDWTAIQPAPVIGVDEVGRGCLAGPVVAAAVILSYPQKKVFADSKLVPADRREELLKHVESEHRHAVGFASVEEINTLNILHASLLAMRRAVEGLGLLAGGHVLVDGIFKVPGLPEHFTQTTFVKGDSRCEPISAASIVAKVSRDRYMKN